MKNIIKTLLLATTLMMCGCGVGRIVDWYPVNIRIYVQDAEGNDLLNPNNENFLGSQVEAEWLDKLYTYTHPQTREYLPRWSGLTLQTHNGTYYLELGELAGDVEYDDDLTIRWPDGSQDVIHYKSRVNHITVDAHRTFKLNGEKCDNPVVIVK
ncbi:MAG: hypothetical protein II323_06625 [Tidjanibacter sp.]|nr:hypothetical protein [Tidjanibacter sp.]